MSLDEAIKQIQLTIESASADADVKVVKVSDEEARISVYAPADDMQAIKDATFQPVQVFVYDKDNPVAAG